ncbi:MAG: hypothetical protein IJI22_01245 [Bacilli bacterium]|nr:hypothetical protein [Bacilli bacterium]
MLDKYLNKEVKLIVTFAAAGGGSLYPVSYYGKILNYDDEYIEMDVARAETEGFPAALGKIETGVEGKTLVNKKYVISINEI